MTDYEATLPAVQPASRLLAVLIVAIVLAGVPAAFSSGGAWLVYLPYACVGALLVIRRPRNVIGWLLIGIGWAFLAGRTILLTGLAFGESARWHVGRKERPKGRRTP